MRENDGAERRDHGCEVGDRLRKRLRELVLKRSARVAPEVAAHVGRGDRGELTRSSVALDRTCDNRCDEFTLCRDRTAARGALLRGGRAAQGRYIYRACLKRINIFNRTEHHRGVERSTDLV